MNQKIEKISKHQFYFETPLYQVLNLDNCEDSAGVTFWVRKNGVFVHE